METEGGEVSSGEDYLEIRGANSAVIKLVASSNFRDYKNVDLDPAALCAQKLAISSGKKYKQLYQDHLGDFQELYSRSAIHLDSPNPSFETTDERIEVYLFKRIVQQSIRQLLANFLFIH